jgi:hypothetical protein
MKTNIAKIGSALLAGGMCLWSTETRAQTTTTVTTTKGAFSEFVPASKTVVVRTEASSPLRYVVSKQTTIVDETGTPVTIERISPGSPLSIEYTGTGENLVASRIIVQRPATVAAPVTTTSAPVVTEEHTTTTTATTRALTHDEKEALKEQKHERKEQLEKEIERRKEALEKAKDKLEDDDHD